VRHSFTNDPNRLVISTADSLAGKKLFTHVVVTAVKSERRLPYQPEERDLNSLERKISKVKQTPDWDQINQMFEYDRQLALAWIREIKYREQEQERKEWHKKPLMKLVFRAYENDDDYGVIFEKETWHRGPIFFSGLFFEDRIVSISYRDHPDILKSDHANSGQTWLYLKDIEMG
jgi:hypothetical protein